MPDSADTVRWVTLLHCRVTVGRVDHALRRGGKPGNGWHTYCGQWWADGPRTNNDGWSFKKPDGTRRKCKPCDRAVTALIDGPGDGGSMKP